METLPIGQAQIARKGDDITLISYGASLRPTLEAAELLEEEDGVKAEVVDLLSIAPLDTATIVNSVQKTGRCVIVHEGPRTCGLAAEIIARINEKVFFYLEAPIIRVTGYDIPIPYFARERAYLPDADKVLDAARITLSV
jgi:pyruvate dehydrogenase E1 component beta subunit